MINLISEVKEKWHSCVWSSSFHALVIRFIIRSGLFVYARYDFPDAYETIGPGGFWISARMHLRGRILTKLAGSIVTRGPSVCDGARVSNDGHERASARDVADIEEWRSGECAGASCDHQISFVRGNLNLD